MQTPTQRIMIVEADRHTSAWMAEILGKQRYETIVVTESTRALEIAEATVPHAFLIDLIMAPRDGFQLCQRLRRHPQFKATPIVIVTALEPFDSKIIAIGAGASDYITKPYAAEDLLWKVRKLLGS